MLRGLKTFLLIQVMDRAKPSYFVRVYLLSPISHQTVLNSAGPKYEGLAEALGDKEAYKALSMPLIMPIPALVHILMRMIQASCE